MELEMTEVLGSLSASLERLGAAASALEQTAARLEQREAAVAGDVQKITAAVDSSEGLRLELERKLAAAEQEIAVLRASAGQSRGVGGAGAVRKTLPPATVQLLAKQGIDSVDGLDTSTLDAALSGLSIEQRLAVKAQLLRSGALIS